MRTARMKVPADASADYYHGLSRVVDRRFLLGEVEKDHFVSLLREYAVFCEVEVLTYGSGRWWRAVATCWGRK